MTEYTGKQCQIWFILNLTLYFIYFRIDFLYLGTFGIVYVFQKNYRTKVTKSISGTCNHTI